MLLRGPLWSEVSTAFFCWIAMACCSLPLVFITDSTRRGVYFAVGSVVATVFLVGLHHTTVARPIREVALALEPCIRAISMLRYHSPMASPGALATPASPVSILAATTSAPPSQPLATIAVSSIHRDVFELQCKAKDLTLALQQCEQSPRTLAHPPLPPPIQYAEAVGQKRPRELLGP